MRLEKKDNKTHPDKKSKTQKRTTAARVRENVADMKPFKVSISPVTSEKYLSLRKCFHSIPKVAATSTAKQAIHNVSIAANTITWQQKNI